MTDKPKSTVFDEDDLHLVEQLARNLGVKRPQVILNLMRREATRSGNEPISGITQAELELSHNDKDMRVLDFILKGLVGKVTALILTPSRAASRTQTQQQSVSKLPPPPPPTAR